MGSKRPGSARVGELRRAQLRCSCELAPTTPSLESGREVGTRQEVSRCDGGIRHVSPGRHAPWFHDVVCDLAGDSRWIAVKSASPIAIHRLRRPTPSCRSFQVARLSDLRRLSSPIADRRSTAHRNYADNYVLLYVMRRPAAYATALGCSSPSGHAAWIVHQATKHPGLQLCRRDPTVVLRRELSICIYCASRAVIGFSADRRTPAIKGISQPAHD